MRCFAVYCLLLFWSSNLLAQTDVVAEFQARIDAQAKYEYPHAYFSNTTVLDIQPNGEKVDVYLEVTDKVLNDLGEHAEEEYMLVLYNLLEQTGKVAHEFYIRLPNRTTVPLGKLLEADNAKSPAYIAPKNNDPFPAKKGNLQSKNIPYSGQAKPTGGLSGKTIWLSPGHGWIYSTALGRYATQRGNTNDIVEDFGTTEAVGYYLLKYLWNAGANVWMVRERDYNTNEVVVDNDVPASGYSETGTWATSGSAGYNGGTYRFANTAATEDASAIFTPNIPEEGWYWISVYFREGANRTADARYKVQHAGGETTVSVNQEIHGQTWIYLGQFYFDAGTAGSVTLTNESSDVGQALIADAVRFGGGMGTEEDCDVAAVGTSGEPRFEEGAQLFARYMGYPVCDGDVSIRPNYAEWELSKGDASEQNNIPANDINSIYISWHTNAGGGTGTSSFIFDPPDNGQTGTAIQSDASGTPTNCDGGAGGIASGYLRNFIHDEVIQDVRAEYDAGWTDRGKFCANFGEIRNLTTMPGALFEMGFHDNATDAMAISTPEYRKIVARAVYQGIVKFFNQYDNTRPTTYLPEPPTHLLAKNDGAGQITLNWNAPTTAGAGGDAATTYRVYKSTHGKGFADAVTVNSTTHTFSNLDPLKTYYFRVSAVNEGGESFPTTVIAARTPASGEEIATPILLVDGFDRLQRSQMVYQFDSAPLGSLYRGFLEVMNSYTYMVEHARAFESCCAFAFDGASNEAVIDDDLCLTNYQLVNWICGEESTTNNSLDATERMLIETFLDGQGKLMISGSEIGWDIGRAASPNADVAFYNNYLKTTYLGDNSSTYNFAGVAAQPFDGVTGAFDDGSARIYDVNFPDRMQATGGGITVINYTGGTADGAATAYKGSDFGVVNFGFPLETVADPATRQSLICNALDFLLFDDGELLCNTTIIQAKVFMQGPYNGGSMQTDLNNGNLIAAIQPYTSTPNNYLGNEQTNMIPPNAVDWVLVEIRDPNDDTNILARRACFVRNDGQLIDLDGNLGVRFVGLSVSSGYISIRHRNHLGVMTANTVSFN